VATSVALVAYTSKPAAAVLDPTQTYVRVDGTFVGTGDQLAQGRPASDWWWYDSDDACSETGFFLYCVQTEP
jgi:hypothetical protein